MTMEFSRRKFMASAGGTALASFALPAVLGELPGEAPAGAAGTLSWEDIGVAHFGS